MTVNIEGNINIFIASVKIQDVNVKETIGMPLFRFYTRKSRDTLSLLLFSAVF